MTGLASLAHLRSRLSELYRGELRRAGPTSTPRVQETYALIVLDLPFAASVDPDGVTRALQLAQLGVAARTVFPGTEITGRLGLRRIGVLATREAGLGRRVALLRTLTGEVQDPGRSKRARRACGSRVCPRPMTEPRNSWMNSRARSPHVQSAHLARRSRRVTLRACAVAMPPVVAWTTSSKSSRSRRVGSKPTWSPTTTSRRPRTCMPSWRARRATSPKSEGREPPPQRQLRVFQWGLIPSWAKEASIGNRMINARMETVAEKPAYRRAFAARRCLLPADGYFEWYPTTDLTAKGKPRKQPFFIRPRDLGVLAMAGVYEIWRDPGRGRGRPEPVPLDGQHHHDRGRGFVGSDPRPDADDGGVRTVGRVARSTHFATRGVVGTADAGCPRAARGISRLNVGQQRAQQRPRTSRAASR